MDAALSGPTPPEVVVMQGFPRLQSTNPPTSSVAKPSPHAALSNLLAGARLSFREKLAWLEDVSRFYKAVRRSHEAKGAQADPVGTHDLARSTSFLMMRLVISFLARTE